VEKKIQDINKQMLEASYTLDLGQLFKITPNLKNTYGKK
jgi:hypothetical protein